MSKNRSNIEKIIGQTFILNGKEVTDQPFKTSKIICLYFGSSWNPQDEGMIYLLNNLNLSSNSQKNELSIISISKEIKKSEYENKINKINFLNIPYSDSRLDLLFNYLDIRQIPQILVLQANGEILTKKGKLDLLKERNNCFLKWKSKLMKKKSNNQDN